MTRYLASIDPKRVPLFAMAALALVSAGLALYVVLPQVKARRAAFEEKAALEQVASAAAALSVQRLALEGTVRELIALSAEPGEPASQQALAAAMIDELQQGARRHGVDLVAIEPRAGEQIDTFQEVVFEVELVGAYGDLVEYVRDVRTELAPLVVRELSLTPLDDSAQPPIRAVLVAAAFGEVR